MSGYIYELPDWPDFRWDAGRVLNHLAEVRYKQAYLIGRMEDLGFKLKDEATLQALTTEVVKSAEIEGENLDPNQVRSSIARQLGIDNVALLPSDLHVDGVVEMLLDATRKYDLPLTPERLFGWHRLLFPTGYSGMRKIIVGSWRDDKEGRMEVRDGVYGSERVYYVAPVADRLEKEMSTFLKWINHSSDTDLVLKAGIAHLWFVTIHPFDDGNGRIARALSDLMLARSEESRYRFYSMSAQIRLERDEYYSILGRTQKGSLDISPWLEWFLGCLSRALARAEGALKTVLLKASFWKAHEKSSLNERQRRMLNMLLDGFEGKLTTSKWAKITKTSNDTALRDINNLIEQNILIKEDSGGRSTSYSLKVEDEPGP